MRNDTFLFRSVSDLQSKKVERLVFAIDVLVTLVLSTNIIYLLVLQVAERDNISKHLFGYNTSGSDTVYFFCEEKDLAGSRSVRSHLAVYTVRTEQPIYTKLYFPNREASEVDELH